MKYLLILATVFSTYVQANQDLDVILRAALIVNDDVKQQMCLALATQAHQMGAKNVEITDLATEIGKNLENPEFFQKFYPFFTANFSADEIKQIRVISEDTVYKKYQKNMMSFSQVYMAEVNNLLSEMVKLHSEEKAPIAKVEEEKPTIVEAKVLEITPETYAKEVEEASKLVVVDVYADWCGPCKNMTPVFDELCGEFTDVKFVKLNSDENVEIRKRLDVSSLPTFIFMKDGKVLDRHIGMMDKEEFANKIKEHVG